MVICSHNTMHQAPAILQAQCHKHEAQLHTDIQLLSELLRRTQSNPSCKGKMFQENRESDSVNYLGIDGGDGDRI